MWMETGLRQARAVGEDLNIAVRKLRRSPWYSTTVIGTAALTMALASTVFTVVDGVLFKPLPYERADELFDLSGGYSEALLAQRPRGGAMNRAGLGVSALDAQELQSAVPGVDVVVFSAATSAPRLGDLRSWAPLAYSVDRRLLQVLGVQPLIGGFSDDDFQTAPEAVQPALLSYGAWQSRFGGRPDIVGDVVEVGSGDGTRLRVVGVLPTDFLFPTAGRQPDLLTPLILPPENPADRRRSLRAVARVPAHMPIADVQARFDAVARTAREVIPDRQLNGGMGPWDVAALRPLSTALSSRQRTTFRLVFITALALVLLGCVNVSGLVASRGLERQRELALRRALGAGQGAVARLLVSELAVLFGVGTVIGVAASRPAVGLAVRLLPENMGLLREPALDWRVMAFAALATALSIGLVSIWPLRQSRRVALSSAMTDGAHASVRARSIGRFAIVSLQVMLGFSLTLAGVLLVGSLVRIWRTDVGYPTDHLLIVEGSVEGSDAAGRQAGLGNFLESVRRIPGVTAAGATGASLLRSGLPGGMWRAHTYAVTAGFFDAVPIAVVDGRLPSNDELRAGAAVAAITEPVAAQYFPGQQAIGQLLREEGQGQNAFTVVGIVEYARYGSWTTSDETGGQIYIPLLGGRRFSAVVRTAPSAGPLLAAILEAAKAGPVQLSTAASAERLLVETIRSQRFQAWLFGTFAGGALTIVGVGVLGLMAITTARRARELAIRMTLGARRRSIVRLILGEELAPIVVGLVGGSLVSVWVARILRTYLYDTTPFDPAIWGLAAVAILGVALVGILIPAHRATQLDPARVLRAE